MDLTQIAADIRAELDEARQKMGLTFTEEGHRYTLNGFEDKYIPSVSGVVSRFYKPFDSDLVAERMSKGDEVHKLALLEEWAEKGRIARLTGNYAHYHLEKYLVDLFEIDKGVREPLLEGLDETIRTKGDKMIVAGKAQVDKMIERGGILIDTEVVMGSIDAGYVGQCDCAWVGLDVDGNVKLCLTDWKTNKPSKFSISNFNVPMYEPFEMMLDNAVGKYSLQLGLYERLMLEMLKNKYEFSNSIIVHLMQRPVGKFKEYRISDTIRPLIHNLKI